MTNLYVVKDALHQVMKVLPPFQSSPTLDGFVQNESDAEVSCEQRLMLAPLTSKRHASRRFYLL